VEVVEVEVEAISEAVAEAEVPSLAEEAEAAVMMVAVVVAVVAPMLQPEEEEEEEDNCVTSKRHTPMETDMERPLLR